MAQTYSRASDDVKSIMNNFDQTTNVRRESTKHKRGEDSDITTIVNILKEIEAFCEVLEEHILMLDPSLKTPYLFLTLQTEMHG